MKNERRCCKSNVQQFGQRFACVFLGMNQIQRCKISKLHRHLSKPFASAASVGVINSKSAIENDLTVLPFVKKTKNCLGVNDSFTRSVRWFYTVLTTIRR